LEQALLAQVMQARRCVDIGFERLGIEKHPASLHHTRTEPDAVHVAVGAIRQRQQATVNRLGPGEIMG
jgi:hypothetical protein